MARDNSLAVRRAILAQLKSDPKVSALVSADAVHPQAPLSIPAWPFIRIGSPSSVPIEASCARGDSVVIAVHAFAKARLQAGAMAETAEDHVHRIAAAIVAALHRRRLNLSPDGAGVARWTGSNIVQDGDESDAFHAICNFTVRCLA